MKFIIDDANIENIKKVYKSYPVDGVTTNPSILAKTGKNPYDALKEIREFIGQDAELHVQAISKEPEDMLKEAYKITDILGKNTYIKIPTITKGLQGMKILVQNGFNVTATAVYTPMQAYLAAKIGAEYVAPYVNRIDNIGNDGIQTTKTIYDIFKRNGYDTKVLAASFKNSQQVLELCKYGIDAATIGIDVIDLLIKNKEVESAVETFTDDFEKLCGKGRTMLNC